MSAMMNIVVGGPTGPTGNQGVTGPIGPTGPGLGNSLAYCYGEGIISTGAYDILSSPYVVKFKNMGTSDNTVLVPGTSKDYIDILVEDDYRIDFGLSGSLNVTYTEGTTGSNEYSSMGISVLLYIYDSSWTLKSTKICRTSSSVTLTNGVSDYFPDVSCNGSWIGNCPAGYKVMMGVRCNYAASNNITIDTYTITLDSSTSVCYMNVY